MLLRISRVTIKRLVEPVGMANQAIVVYFIIIKTLPLAGMYIIACFSDLDSICVLLMSAGIFILDVSCLTFRTSYFDDTRTRCC